MYSLKISLLPVFFPTAYCSLRNEMERNEMKRNEMKICSLRNKNLLSRRIYPDILNRKFPPKKPFRLESSDCMLGMRDVFVATYKA